MNTFSTRMATDLHWKWQIALFYSIIGFSLKWCCLGASISMMPWAGTKRDFSVLDQNSTWKQIRRQKAKQTNKQSLENQNKIHLVKFVKGLYLGAIFRVKNVKGINFNLNLHMVITLFFLSFFLQYCSDFACAMDIFVWQVKFRDFSKWFLSF